MCRYRGTDRLLLSIEIACSCVSTIGKESSGEKQHDDDVCAGVCILLRETARNLTFEHSNKLMAIMSFRQGYNLAIVVPHRPLDTMGVYFDKVR